MSRELKFRAWEKGNEEMIVEPAFIAVEGNGDYSVFSEKYNEWLHDNCEIMQFAGLKDKNGTDIYEGDIGEIKTQSGRVERFTVEWGIHRRDMASGWTVDIPGFCFRIEGFPSFPIVNNYLNGHDLDIIEIIGNIYQPPTTDTTK
jgi:uncharacterized phage protein (TIGR01671 family)